MSRAAALLVTHNSQRWIEQTVASVLAQTRMPDGIVVIDDQSTDATLEIVRRLTGGEAVIHPSTSVAGDRTTRIAQNFRQGVQACAGHDIAVLGDHDDVWLPGRMAHQVAVLNERPGVAMVASDGRLVDEDGRPSGGSLRSAFPVPVGFNTMPAGERMRATLRRSIATGGASAIRPQAFADLAIPPGWLHDRWWSLVATAQESMWVDGHIVIDYRVTAGQEVGLDPGSQDRTPLGRAALGLGSVSATVRRLRDLRGGLAPLASPAASRELDWPHLVRNLL